MPPSRRIRRRRDRVLAVIDARRGEVFAAAYDRAAGGEIVPAAAPRAVDPRSLGPVLIEAGFPGGAGRVIVIGDGAVRYRQEIGEDLGEMAPPDEHPASRGCVGRLPDRRRRPRGGRVRGRAGLPPPA